MREGRRAGSATIGAPSGDFRFAALTYHAVTSDDDRDYTVRPVDLDAQLRFLTEHEFVIDGVPEFQQRLDGDLSWPQRYVLWTVDDGHDSALHIAEAVRERGGQATFYLNRQLCQCASGLNTQGIKELARLCSIGSHGLRHVNYRHLTSRELWNEFSGSRKWLQDVTGDSIDSFAIPGGATSKLVERVARQAGYGLVLVSGDTFNTLPSARKTGLISRTAVRQFHSIPNFEKAVYCDNGFYQRQWLRQCMLQLPKRLLTSGQISSVKRLRKVLMDMTSHPRQHRAVDGK
jgi:peptidoglycan/xylan/chitin deacetylase (PgdA/CDA1 family)